MFGPQSELNNLIIDPLSRLACLVFGVQCELKLKITKGNSLVRQSHTPRGKSKVQLDRQKFNFALHTTMVSSCFEPKAASLNVIDGHAKFVGLDIAATIDSASPMSVRQPSRTDIHPDRSQEPGTGPMAQHKIPKIPKIPRRVCHVWRQVYPFT